MDLNDILKMNPKSECKITYDGYYEWSDVHFQNKESNELDVNTLPLLDDKYINETGEPLTNDNQEEVFNPNQKIEYLSSMNIPWGHVYTSKTFISLLQKKINEFIDEEKPDLNDKYVSEEFIGWLGLLGLGARSAIDDIAYLIGCKDLNQISEKDEEDTYLWFTALEMNDEGGEVTIEEL
tara:strand:+ start:140 stop:679 length:540 start_codon:yes stop_codon:yes gene_type:complete